jgi:hypothetical protein
MKVTLQFNDDEAGEAKTALRAEDYRSCLFDVANMLRRTQKEDGWDCDRIHKEFWRICTEDYNIDPWGEET